MKKVLGLIISGSITAGLLTTTSCSDDPPIKPKLSFAESTMTVNEADGVIEIQVMLDRPALEDFTIDYELDGTAQDEETASNNTDFPDYVVVEDESDYGEINIEKGETTGIIQIELYSDFDLEDDETIEIKIIDVDSDLIEITRDDDIEITVVQEDGLLLFLSWDESYTDVDMDLFTWWPSSTGNLELAGGSTNPSYSPPEFIFLHNNLEDGQYGVSCNYYEGTPVEMNFTLSLVPFNNGSLGAEVERNGTYDSGNINAWDSSGNDPLIALTYTKSGSSYTNFSELLVDINSTGSRTTDKIKSIDITKGVKSKFSIKKDLVNLFK